MKLTYYGQSCFLIDTEKHRFLFDPFITPNDLAKDVDIKKIEADYILVSHGHSDHTADLVKLAKQTGATVISNYEIISWAQKQGVKNVHPMNFGSFTFDFGTLTLFQAMHSSSLDDLTYMGNPGGFILESAEGNFYYSGDTSLFTDMQLVSHYAEPDVCIFPVGGNFTMNAKDAVAAGKMVGCNNVVGVHFDTFGYIKIDHAETEKTFKEAGIKFLLPQIGQTYDIV